MQRSTAERSSFLFCLRWHVHAAQSTALPRDQLRSSVVPHISSLPLHVPRLSSFVSLLHWQELHSFCEGPRSFKLCRALSASCCFISTDALSSTFLLAQPSTAQCFWSSLCTQSTPQVRGYGTMLVCVSLAPQGKLYNQLDNSPYFYHAVELSSNKQNIERIQQHKCASRRVFQSILTSLISRVTPLKTQVPLGAYLRLWEQAIDA